jgi:hypothetical protein
MAFYLSIQNNSAAVQQNDIDNLIPDIQAQLNNEFGQAWGVAATINSVGGGWLVTINDQPGPSDPQGALGYHYIDQNGNPYAVIFAQLAIDNGVTWQSVLDHEVLEMLADPLVDSVAYIDDGQNQGTGWIVYEEACDPCEALTYYGSVNGNPLSDFVFPEWYIPAYQGQVDYLGQIQGSLILASGGYASVDQIIKASGWQAITADLYKKLAERTKHTPKAIQTVEMRKRQPKSKK